MAVWFADFQEAVVYVGGQILAWAIVIYLSLSLLLAMVVPIFSAARRLFKRK